MYQIFNLKKQHDTYSSYICYQDHILRRTAATTNNDTVVVEVCSPELRLLTFTYTIYDASNRLLLRQIRSATKTLLRRDVITLIFNTYLLYPPTLVLLTSEYIYRSIYIYMISICISISSPLNAHGLS